MRPVAGSKRNTLASGIEPPLARLTSPPAMTTLPPERRCATCAIRCESAADCTSVKVSFTGTYAEKIEGIPYPTDQVDWRKKCSWLRSEIARQQNIASSGTTQPGTFPYDTQVIARNNVATLDSRMSDFHCNAGYVSSAPPSPAKSNIETCIEACKANTHRTPEKCLDACNPH